MTTTTRIFLSKGFGKPNIASSSAIKSKGVGEAPYIKHNKEQLSSKKIQKQEEQQQEVDASASTAATTTTTATRKSSPSSLNSGQQALQDLRRQAAEQKDAELRKVRDVVAQDQQMAAATSSQEGGAAIPEKVAQRILQRMIPFVGLPLLGGMGMFVLFWYLAVYRDLEFQPVVVATSTFVLLALGLLGITYSVMSASWDPERQGSGLGFDEFQTNVQTIREGLSRSRENAMVRDQMALLTPDEIQTALQDLQQREAAAEQSKRNVKK